MLSFFKKEKKGFHLASSFNKFRQIFTTYFSHARAMSFFFFLALASLEHRKSKVFIGPESSLYFRYEIMMHMRVSGMHNVQNNVSLFQKMI